MRAADFDPVHAEGGRGAGGRKDGVADGEGVGALGGVDGVDGAEGGVGGEDEGGGGDGGEAVEDGGFGDGDYLFEGWGRVFEIDGPDGGIGLAARGGVPDSGGDGEGVGGELDDAANAVCVWDGGEGGGRVGVGGVDVVD